MAADHPAHQLAVLEERLRPAPPDIVDDAIDLVLEGHGGRATSEARARAYCIALEGLPAAAIAAGVEAVLQGRVPGIRPDFPPTAPQLAAACRAFRDRDAARLVAARRNMLPAPPTPATQASPAVAAGLLDLADQLRRTAAEGSLARSAGAAIGESARAAEQRARAARVAAGLAGRSFPLPPSAEGRPA